MKFTKKSEAIKHYAKLIEETELMSTPFNGLLVKLNGYLVRNPKFCNDVSEYEFANFILEGDPVWEGDTLWCKDGLCDWEVLKTSQVFGRNLLREYDKKHLSWKAPVKKGIILDGTALEVGDKILSNHSGKIYEIFKIDYTNFIVYMTSGVVIVFDDIKNFKKVRKMRVVNINGIDYTLPVCNSFSELLELDKDLFKTIGKEFFK